VDCPTCDEEDKLYLAVISVKSGEVQKVCNFSLRKYVKSFPTVEYWLSLIPIIPLIKRALESFCCAALPPFFRKRDAPQAKLTGDEIVLAENRVSGKNIRAGVEFVKTTDFRGAARERTSKFTSGRSLFFDAIRDLAPSKAAASAGLVHSDLAGQPVAEVQRKLAEAKIKATVEPYNPAAGVSNLVEFGRAPLRLQEGMEVTLITRDDKVLYYSVVEPESPQIRALRGEVAEVRGEIAEAARLRDQVETLRKEMSESERKHAEALVARDNEIAELKARDRDLQLNIRAVNELKEEIAKLRPPPRPRRPGKKEQ
ncbi:MAG TPA: hypothetical protein VLA73_03220, partial [Burkholderiales bacterium]|nr:hypothetical protein [Burkholderiales bacterium]